MESNKYLDTLKKYDTELNDTVVKDEVEKIISDGFAQNNTKEVLNFSLGCIDLTSLNPTDSDERIREFVNRVNLFDEKYPQLNNVASICVALSRQRSSQNAPIRSVRKSAMPFVRKSRALTAWMRMSSPEPMLLLVKNTA